MSQEKVLKTLESLGLAKLEAQVYILLGKKGPQKAKDIAKTLKIRKQRLYILLKNLESKGIVSATIEHPARFSALPFDKALDLFMKAKIEEAQRIEQGRKELFSDWQSISIAETADQSPRFSVIEGRKFIYPRLKQMIEETRNGLLIVSTFSGLVRADQFGLVDAAFNHVLERKTPFKFLTEISPHNLNAVKAFLERIPKRSSFEGRTPEFGLKLTPRMLIRDDAEVAFFVSEDKETPTTGEVDDLCLWTNSSAIVDSFKAVFEDLWNNSASIKSKIAEIETGKSIPKTCVISDTETANKKHAELINSAEKEIVMITSSAGLVEACRNISLLEEKAEKGASIKIMAPIIKSNLKDALQLSGCCKVRHVASSYLGTTIVDGKYLLQFKNAESDSEGLQKPAILENAFYTNDLEYVGKTRSMLDNVWKNASVVSSVTVEDITKPLAPTIAPVPDDEYTISRKDSPYQKTAFRTMEEPGRITEEHVLNKIINAKKISVKDPKKDPVFYYGSNASALIHPPNSFNLPDMILILYHCNKQSSYGSEDWFIVSSWLETPMGKAYVPVALVGDNLKAMERRKLTFAGTPAGKNIHVLGKNKIRIQVHGNSLFAGWAVPIPLFPPQYVLPPASLLFEGYGKLKTVVTTSVLPSGAKVIQEGNGFDAFVTFFHPSSKYAGPGTDGIVTREIIATVYPPTIRSSNESSKQSSA